MIMQRLISGRDKKCIIKTSQNAICTTQAECWLSCLVRQKYSSLSWAEVCLQDQVRRLNGNTGEKKWNGSVFQYSLAVVPCIWQLLGSIGTRIQSSCRIWGFSVVVSWREMLEWPRCALDFFQTTWMPVFVTYFLLRALLGNASVWQTWSRHCCFLGSLLRCNSNRFLALSACLTPWQFGLNKGTQILSEPHVEQGGVRCCWPHSWPGMLPWTANH